MISLVITSVCGPFLIANNHAAPSIEVADLRRHEPPAPSNYFCWPQMPTEEPCTSFCCVATLGGLDGDDTVFSGYMTPTLPKTHAREKNLVNNLVAFLARELPSMPVQPTTP